jgi:hypothetical protein
VRQKVLIVAVLESRFPLVAFFSIRQKKNNPHISVLRAFPDNYVLKQVVKFNSIKRPLAGFRRGANLPYFAKRDEILAYFPHKTKRRVLRGFPA